jgi:Raf kinase inhibitor-like YbhB/YbcL family protein
MEQQAKRQNYLPLMLFMLGFALFTAQSRLDAEEKMSLTLSSTAFTHNGEIPSKYTCEGKEISPPLFWDGAPEGARSLVLIVDDPDAPDPKAPKRTWVHWVLYNLPPEAGSLREGVTSRDLPPGTKEGINDSHRTGYGSPCPPIGRHRYFFKLYALDTALEFGKNPTKAEVEAAMRGHVIEHCELVGTYEKR